MSRYLLDTDVLIDYAYGKEPAVSRIKGLIAQGDDLGLCAIAVAEFFAGLRPHQRDYWRRVLSTFVSWDVSFDAARCAGEWRYDFERRGITQATSDTLNAAVAVERGATLLTRNARDYPMEGLSLLPLIREAGSA